MAVDEAGFGRPTSPTVTVRGEALIRAEPDEALLWITLSALEETPGPALADVAARSKALVALLDEAGVAKADRSTSGISVHEEFEHTEKGRRSLGHRAVSRESVRIADPELMGRLISQTTADLDAQVDGPSWLISLDNPVRLEAARQAAADARRRAQAYADGVGAGLGRVVRLSEANERHIGIPTGYGARAQMRNDPMTVEPGEHEVGASIQATFELDADPGD